MDNTVRQDITELLELSINGLSPEQISHQVSDGDRKLSDSDVIKHIKHIRKSLRESEKQLFVLRPECNDCEFSEFKTTLGVPSKCPNCRSEWISPPKFKID